MGLLAPTQKAGLLNQPQAGPNQIFSSVDSVFSTTNESTPATKGALPYDPYSQESIDRYEGGQRLSKGADLPDAGGIIKNLGQGLLRGYAAAAATIASLPVTVSANIKALINNKSVEYPPGTGEFTPEPSTTDLGKFEQALYGTDKPISLQSVAEELPGVPRGAKYAPIIGALGTVLDLTGAGEEAKGLTGLTKALTATKDATEASNLLRRAGFASDIAEHAGPKFANITDATEVKKGLLSLQELQNTTTRSLGAAKAGAEASSSIFPTATHAAEAVEKAFPTSERGFTESVGQQFPELADRVGGQYIPRSTDTLAMQAKNLIKDTPDVAEHLARTGTDERAVATAAEYIKKLTDDALQTSDKALQHALYDKAATIANDAARNLTDLGRAVQAASILGRLTPEGLVRFAARSIQKYNEGIDTSITAGRGSAPTLGQIVSGAKKIPELTAEQTADILKQAKLIEQMPDGLGKARAFKGLIDHISTLVPSPLWKKLIGVWKAGLLTGLKTTGVNVMSNLFHGVSELAKDVPAAVVDSVASLFTGERTLALTGKGVGGGLKEGFQKGWDYLKTGFDERDAVTKLDYTKINFGTSKVAKAIQKYEETIFRLLGAEDQPFYYGSKAHSLASQALAQVKNEGLKGAAATKRAQELVENPTDKMLRYAVYDAETAVFQNKTALGSVGRALQNIPGGEIVVPFSKTPAAVAMQLLNYSPAGFVKPISRIIGGIKEGKFDQRLFSQEVGRAVVGTGVMYIGGKLFEQGVLSLGRPTSESELKQWQLEGRSANSVLIHGKWRSVNVLGPAGYTLLLGGYFSDGLAKTGSVIGALAETAAGAGKSLTDQTFLRGLDQFISTLTNPAQNAKTYFTGLIGSLVPTLVSDVARGTDTVERRTTEGVLDTAQSRIPGLREKLEPQVDTFGQPVATPDFFTAMLDPTRPTAAKNDPVVSELQRLWDAGYKATPTQLGDKNGYPVLTPKQNTALWESAGQLAKSKLTNLMQLPQYAQADDEEKQKLITQITDMAKTVARAQVVLELTHGLTGQDLKDELSRLKAGKLMTIEVFNQYLKLR